MTHPQTERLTPSEYLTLAASAPASLGGKLVTVKGKVDLRASPLRSHIRVLPPALIDGELFAEDCPMLKKVSCSTRHDLRLSRSGVTEITSEVEVGGSLSVELCKSLRTLDCRVRGSVTASGSTLVTLGGSFGCGGTLDLFQCRELRQLGKMLSAPEDVRASQSGLEEAREGFICRGNLVLEKVNSLRRLSGSVGGTTSISHAPTLVSISKLVSWGNISISKCPLLKNIQFITSSGASFYRCGFKSISPGSRAGGELSIIDCEKFMGLGGEWTGSVTLVDLPALSFVNSDFETGGDLVIRKTPELQALSGRVARNSYLAAAGSVRCLDGGFFTKGDLTIEAQGSGLTVLGCRVGGNLVVVGPSRLGSTLTSLKVGRSATFIDNERLSVLRGEVAGNVELLQHSSPIKIGADFECGADLLLSGCHSDISLNCVVHGNIVVEDAKLVKTGPVYKCHGVSRSTSAPVSARSSAGSVAA